MMPLNVKFSMPKVSVNPRMMWLLIEKHSKALKTTMEHSGSCSTTGPPKNFMPSPDNDMPATPAKMLLDPPLLLVAC